MKLVSYNIQYGFGADGIYDLSRAAGVIEGADIIALQEVERHWSRSNFDDQPKMLEDMLPDYFSAYGPAFDMDASFRVEDGRVVNRRRQFGTMILSRYRILWSRLHLLPMRRVLNPLNTQNAALECLIDLPCGPVRVWSLHLSHIGVEERLEQIAFLKDLHQRATSSGGPWSGLDDEAHRGWTQGEAEPSSPLEAIWMGDFNSEPGSAEHAAITGRNPYHAGALYADSFIDAGLAARSENGGDAYSHIRYIDERRQERRLDYCFIGAPLADRLVRQVIDVQQDASDHFPVWTEIDLERKLAR